jgi:undecaprenyl-diphosphatase
MKMQLLTNKPRESEAAKGLGQDLPPRRIIPAPGRERSMESLNHSLFLALNASAEPSPAVVLLAIIAAKYLIALVPLHIGLLWLGGSRLIRLVALTSMLALTIALTANQIIGLVAYTPRPFLIGLGHQLIDHRPSSSFPSNHGTIVFTYAASLGFCRVWRLSVVVVCLGLLVAWSRIYLGVHFPFDMLGAAIVSTLAAFVSNQVMLRCAGAILHEVELWTARLTVGGLRSQYDRPGRKLPIASGSNVSRRS